MSKTLKKNSPTRLILIGELFFQNFHILEIIGDMYRYTYGGVLSLKNGPNSYVWLPVIVIIDGVQIDVFL